MFLHILIFHCFICLYVSLLSIERFCIFFFFVYLLLRILRILINWSFTMNYFNVAKPTDQLKALLPSLVEFISNALTHPTKVVSDATFPCCISQSKRINDIDLFLLECAMVYWLHTISFNKASAQVLCRLRSCSQHVGGLQWWDSSCEIAFEHWKLSDWKRFWY